MMADPSFPPPNMKVLLSILAGINALASFLIFFAAKSAIHEILAAVTFLACAVLLGAVGVMGAVDAARRSNEGALEAMRDAITKPR